MQNPHISTCPVLVHAPISPSSEVRRYEANHSDGAELVDIDGTRIDYSLHSAIAWLRNARKWLSLWIKNLQTELSNSGNGNSGKEKLSGR